MKAVKWDIVFIVLLILSMGGLIVFQVKLLRTGLRAEKMRFERNVLFALRDVQQQLNHPNPISTQVVLTGEIAQVPYPSVQLDTLYQRATTMMHEYLRHRLESRGISVNFTYAITGERTQYPLIADPRFDAESFEFWSYDIGLEGYALSVCNCPLYLHLNIDNLPGYLFGQLKNIILPTLGFLALIVVCFGYFFYTLNRQRRLQLAQNNFINNLTHELKTPVFSISLASKILREKFRGEDGHKYFDLIDKENTKLKTHIERVLELANLEKTRYQLAREPVVVVEVLHALADSVELKAQARGGVLVRRIPEDHRTVSLDRQHFRSVVENLLENALKYSPEEPHIQLRAAFTDKHLSITVSDNGVGIPAGEQQNIFKKFYRVANGDLHDVKGFGLGLNYVQQIMVAHGGTVSVESKPGRGSHFTVEFPLEAGLA